MALLRASRLWDGGHLPIGPPPGVPTWDIGPHDEEIVAAPGAFYKGLRAKGPFAYIVKYAILTCGRYIEVKEVFGDHDRFVSFRGVGLVDFKQADPWRPPSIILEADPPEHTHVCRILAKALSPKVMRESVAMFAETARDMVADVVKMAILAWRQGATDVLVKTWPGQRSVP